MRISERREWVGVSTEEMLMCSKVEGEGVGWETRFDERERERRKEGVDVGSGMTQSRACFVDLGSSAPLPH